MLILKILKSYYQPKKGKKTIFPNFVCSRSVPFIKERFSIFTRFARMVEWQHELSNFQNFHTKIWVIKLF